jgi:hypothetical protein
MSLESSALLAVFHLVSTTFRAPREIERPENYPVRSIWQ